jgi:hypothetical protein
MTWRVSNGRDGGDELVSWACARRKADRPPFERTKPGRVTRCMPSQLVSHEYGKPQVRLYFPRTLGYTALR